ncbi:MAG: PstS family phosphate ABC transporter substrate-binding protein [Spirochaetota bacterium]
MRKDLLFASIAALFMFAISPVSFAGGRVEKESTLSGSVKIAGSSTVYPISVAVAEEFNRLYPDVEIPVQSTGTGGGFKNFFIPGKTDINDASRPIKETERKAAAENGIEAVEFQVATDAITVVVNPEADWISDITVEQLAKIWRPENPAMKWSDVDPRWPDEKIELYGPTSASGTFDFFTEVIIGKEGASRSDYQGTEQDNTIVQAVSGSKYAMGYFGLAYYMENQEKLKALKVEGVIPSIETAKSGTYRPLSRPIYIYVNKESLKRPEVREYVRFYIQQTSTPMIKEIGYVPLTEDEMKQNLRKLENILTELR